MHSVQIEKLKRQYATTAVFDKLEEIKDYASAGRKGNEAVSYDAIERLTKEAINLFEDLRRLDDVCD